MSSYTIHPLADAWLRDLELLLQGIDPGERAEVLAGVREHLDGSLPAGATDDDVRGVLVELGSPQSVADEAYAGRSAPTDATPGLPARWQAVTACGLNVLGLALMALLKWSAVGAETILTGGLLFGLPWCAVIVLSILAPGWTPRQRATSALLYPATLVAISLAAWAMVSLIGPQYVNIIPVLLLLGGAMWTLVRLLKAALR